MKQITSYMNMLNDYNSVILSTDNSYRCFTGILTNDTLNALKCPNNRNYRTGNYYCFYTLIKEELNYSVSQSLGFSKSSFNSIQFILYSPISQITNLPRRALQSEHINHPWLRASNRIRKNSSWFHKQNRTMKHFLLHIFSFSYSSKLCTPSLQIFTWAHLHHYRLSCGQTDATLSGTSHYNYPHRCSLHADRAKCIKHAALWDIFKWTWIIKCPATRKSDF